MLIKSLDVLKVLIKKYYKYNNVTLVDRYMFHLAVCKFDKFNLNIILK